ncbi:hypothetical protein JY651_08850 [Pyxidicoccus parkwayensis]|uniref:Uncharacterized protein n=2 Tax=Pyxidicoccus parkwayensis TaxID=2813578 RepID=A0ABX7PC67_9BACT|nr:hypothetical protein JY651_08850 [Pyxidicoccus parkwaysis]
MAVAAMMVQLMAAGGAGAQNGGPDDRRDASSRDVGKDFAALKNELSSLSAEFNAARERRRLEAEQKKRENEEWHLGPKATPAPAAPPTRGAGAASR